jgi:hypothetical protein
MPDPHNVTASPAAKLLPAGEIACYNVARALLADAYYRMPHSRQGGQAMQAIANAGSALFDLLNVLNATGLQPMAEHELHYQRPGGPAGV